MTNLFVLLAEIVLAGGSTGRIPFRGQIKEAT
jgi:hypothetical protein